MTRVRTTTFPTENARHAELLSASIVPRQRSVGVGHWMLNHVQHDGLRVLVALCLGAAASTAAPATAAAPGPTPAQFTALRTAKGEACPPIRKLACQVLGDPTEYKCQWQERFKGKKWTTSTALVAQDGANWTWLDGGPRCSSLPQH
jgi:hypothetical protein